MGERVSNECAERVFAHGEAGLDEGVVLVDFASDLLDARAYSEKRRESLAKALRERDEARPIVEAAMRQYEAAAPCGWIGAWWLNPAFQTAAIQLHVTCEAAARAAEGGGDE